MMTSNIPNLADLPSSLGPAPEIPRAKSIPATRSRWEDREPREATYTPEVAARIEQIRREEQQLETSLVPLPSPSSPSVTITPLVNVAAPVIKPEGIKPRSRIDAPPFDLPVEGTREFTVAEIFVDPSIQMRAGIDAAIVEEYAELMRSGTRFPPIIVFFDGQTSRLADGFHRVEAAKLAGLENIMAEVKEGDRLQALRYALGANAHHGLRRTNADKRRAVGIALRELADESDRAIAELCGVGNALVGEVRRQVCDSNTSTLRRGRDGKQYPMTKTARREDTPKLDGIAREPAAPPVPSLVSVQNEAVRSVDRVPGVIADEQPREEDAAGNEPPSTGTRVTADLPDFSSFGLVAPTAVADTPRTPHTDAPAAIPDPLPTTCVEDGTVGGVNLVPADQVQRAVDKVRVRDLVSPDGFDLTVHVRRMVPMVAEVLNRYGHEYPDLEVLERSRALGIANAKLQLTMPSTD